MDLKLFFVGMLFFVNPNVNIIDIIPDFFGLMLMFHSLRKLRDLSSDIEKTRIAVIKLIIIDLLKQAALAWTIFSSSEAGFLLVFTLCFTIVELIFFTSMLSSFFNGLLFLGTMHDGSDTLKHLSGIKNASLVLFAVREILTLAPELMYLRIDEELGYLIADFKGGVVVLSVVLQLISGIIWLIFITRYISVVKSDQQFFDNLTEKYNTTVLPRKNLFTERAIKRGIYMFGAAVLLTTNLFLDGVNFIPGYISAIAFILMIILLKKYIKNVAVSVLAASIYLCTATAYEIFNNVFAEKYYNFGISKNFESYHMYITTTVLSAIKALSLILLLLIILRIVIGLINDHTGSEPEYLTERSMNIVKKERHSLRIKAYILFSLLILSSLSSVAQTVFLNYPVFSYWIIDIVIHLVSFIYAVSFIGSFNNQLELKYM